MNSEDVHRALRRIAHEIIERHRGARDVVLIGILTRGVPLARFLQASILEFEGSNVPLGQLDVTAHRDDRSTGDRAMNDDTSLPFDVSDRSVVLVDDVLYTGRTVRAAMDTLTGYGRAAQVELAVLIDRGHRELPIRPDYVGKNVPTAHMERVSVHTETVDGDEGVWIERSADVTV